MIIDLEPAIITCFSKSQRDEIIQPWAPAQGRHEPNIIEKPHRGESMMVDLNFALAGNAVKDYLSRKLGFI